METEDNIPEGITPEIHSYFQAIVQSIRDTEESRRSSTEKMRAEDKERWDRHEAENEAERARSEGIEERRHQEGLEVKRAQVDSIVKLAQAIEYCNNQTFHSVR